MNRTMTALLLALCLPGCATRDDSWAHSGPQRADERTFADAKDACARQTGESGTRDFLFGYGNAFMKCMLGRGWFRVSNPL